MKKLNVFTGFLLLTIVELILGFFPSIETTLLFFTIVGALFLYAKLNLAFTFNQGHGVLEIKKFKIWGFTKGKLIYFGFILLTLLGLLISSYYKQGYPDQDILNMRYIVASLFIAFVISLIVWRVYWFDELFYSSTYGDKINNNVKHFSVSSKFLE